MSAKNRQQWLALLAGAVVLLLAADRLVIGPLTAGWKKRSTRIVELRKKVQEGQSLIQREASLRSRWDQMRTNALPEVRSTAEERVLAGFDRWSQQARVSIMSISPQWKQEGEDFLMLECRVEAAGSLSAISRFLYDIESDPMALRLQALELNSRDSEGQQLALGLQISGLVLRPAEDQNRGAR